MSGSRRLHALLVCGLPALLFLVLHGPALDYEFVWTDEAEIVEGTILRPPGRIPHALLEPLHADLDFRLAGQRQSYYRPLQVALASSVAHLAGKDPRAFRSLSFVLGTATVAAFGAFAWSLLGHAGPALAAASILATHPAGIEVYVWIAGLSAALVDFFVLAAVFAAFLALRSASTRSAALPIALSIGSGVLALLSKESGAALPALVLALAVSMLFATPHRGPLVERVRRMGPRAALLVGIHAGVVVLYVALWRPFVLGGAFTGAAPVGGSLADHVRSTLALWPQVLGWLFAPLQASTGVVVRVVESWADPWTWLGAALPLLSLLLWALLLRRGMWVAAFGLAWIWITYLPVSNAIPLLHARSERDLFACVFGLALLLGGLGTLARGAVARALAAGLAIAFVGLLAQRTHARLPDWRSTRTLFEADLAAEPLHREARFQVAMQLMQQGRAREAKTQLETLFGQEEQFRALSSYLREDAAYELYCRANLEVGTVGDTVRLLERLRARGDAARMPGFLYCAALAMERSSRAGEAIPLYEELAERAPEPARGPFLVAIARIHARLGRTAEARAWLAKIPRETVRDPALEREILAVQRLLRTPPRPVERPQG